ncbi:hypothetical protein Nepgr_030041 [Nepenthes gracilis]|uniref:Uncharacterized protein n=1 Tax=Nepenthes gracilis TaxID=150966 RepID=A0AAD3Y3T5_NEPGR|nr:hypothetical protein Nepgr_030041 [Nepenthes gracilis]
MMQPRNRIAGSAPYIPSTLCRTSMGHPSSIPGSETLPPRNQNAETSAHLQPQTKQAPKSRGSKTDFTHRTRKQNGSAYGDSIMESLYSTSNIIGCSSQQKNCQ